MTDLPATVADRLNADPDLLAAVAGGDTSGLADLDLTTDQLAHVTEVAGQAPEVEGFGLASTGLSSTKTPTLTVRGPSLTWTRPTTATPYVVTQDLQD